MAELATAVIFTWFGMLTAISFLEAPLKFRAPGITLPLGLERSSLPCHCRPGCLVSGLRGRFWKSRR
ncbi:MAG TPA: hypothetical protein VH912_22700 [Streptosporangiaceae bacterium]|jgi:hypothetical protein